MNPAKVHSIPAIAVYTRKTRSLLALVAAIAAFCAGCVGATRLPARTMGPAGESFQKNDLDFSFLDQTETRREEVLRRLSRIDTTYSNPRLFWGRWSESKWGYWWFVASQAGAAGDAKRVWHVHNLLVVFDEDGAIQKKMVFNDEPALWRELHAQLADAPASDLQEPTSIEALTLAPDSVRVSTRSKKYPVIEFSPTKIVRFSHQRFPDTASKLGITCHTLHLAEKTPVGRKIHFCAEPPGVAIMFQYLSQSAPKDMRWD